MLPEHRVALDRAADKHELKAIEDVRKHGVHVLHIFDSEGIAPDFSYTVGLWHTHGHPEILISGLKQSLRHSLLNHLNRLIAAGSGFREGQSSTDVIEKYRCYFQAFRKDQYQAYLGWDLWFYGGNEFDAVQMLWPSVDNVYPWDEQASEYLKSAQEILTPIPLRVQ
jgi:Domain of unknown function (DUF4262)